MPEFWDRMVELQVGSTVITLDDLDIEFVIENDDESKAGTAEIAVYNLGQSKSAFKKDELVQLKAGYKDDYGIVFYGKIDKVWDERDGADVKTVLQASDMTKQLFMAKPICKKYPKGTSIADIVKDLFAEAGIPVGKIEDPGITLEKDMVFGGTTTSTPHAILTEQILPLVNGNKIKGLQLDGALARIGEISDLYTVFVGQDGMGYFVKRNYNAEAIVLDSESGLMEVQDVSEEGKKSAYKVRCIFNWRIRQGTLVQINSITVSGNFKVTKFKHVCRGEEYYTEAEVSPL
ncbi:hypothetical protein [Archaeoglobus profundus]|uniref:Phage protein n=1 Tax=Archaeoglobus profundus (strain DSM 5631 / JCM 9629 / NBRC 100127 / Av18) TaxID=572546 RepID=D2REI6_ARCPA|nr:hypothetical protein [Archaeoglobus profundus]ADB58530.1 hypothetical protein Arcpr_1483 [Archaeoglobus profundus DSM 5631]